MEDVVILSNKTPFYGRDTAFVAAGISTGVPGINCIDLLKQTAIDRRSVALFDMTVHVGKKWTYCQAWTIQSLDDKSK